MVPAGEGSAAECVVSCQRGRESASAMRRAPCRVVSASVSQSSRLEEPPACIHKNSAEFKPVSLQKTAPRGAGTCVLLAGPSRDRSETELV